MRKERGAKMVNVSRLREVMKQRSVSPEAAADAIGIDRATFYRRLERQGSKFTVEEVDKLSLLLKLSAKSMNEIFFDR